MFVRKVMIPLAAAACLTLSACAGADQPTDVDKPNVVVAFYGLEYTAQQVIGDAANISTLTQPGAEAHGLELKPGQIAEIGEADLVVHLKQFQPAVDAAIAQSGNENVLDVAEAIELLPADAHATEGHEEHPEEGHDHTEEGHEDHTEEGHDHTEEGHDHADEGHDHTDEGHEDHAEEGHDHADHDHGDHDPHYWLDPMRMAEVGQHMADQLGKQYPELDEKLQENAKAFATEMQSLDKEFTEGLKQCERKEFITAHQAFNYLAANYGLTEIGISGINPDGEPSPARIAEVQKLAKEHGVTTIFFETLTSPAVAEAIAGDLGLKTAVLDPLEGITDNSPAEDYPSVMRANLEALKEANGCS